MCFPSHYMAIVSPLCLSSRLDCEPAQGRDHFLLNLHPSPSKAQCGCCQNVVECGMRMPGRKTEQLGQSRAFGSGAWRLQWTRILGIPGLHSQWGIMMIPETSLQRLICRIRCSGKRAWSLMAERSLYWSARRRREIRMVGTAGTEWTGQTGKTLWQKKKIHRTCQRTNRMWGTSEKEVATMILDVLSLGSRDMKRLNWNVLEEEVILGGGETSTWVVINGRTSGQKCL